ncbi:MAG: DUF11 domain-containing protein [Planctomycetaceae bacterium]|jgi:uncharacterized repeat protein (TIGR01451 family)|nr:DUF11 domain-containing protein [Planctomycetaceae bacterium]
MSCRINRFYVAILGVAFFAVQAFAQPLPMDKQTNQTILPIRVVNAHAPIYLGQDEPTTERKGFGLADRIKRIFTNLTRDDAEPDDAPPNNPQDSVRSLTSQSVPTRPPKPPTALEIKQSVENPDQPPERRVPDRRTAPEKRRETTNSAANTNKTPVPSAGENIDRNMDSEESDESIYKRMNTMRQQIFDKQHLNENAYRELNSVKTNRETVLNTPAARTAQAVPPNRTPPQRAVLDTMLDGAVQTPQVSATPNTISTDDEPVNKPVEITRRTERNKTTIPVRPQTEFDNTHLSEPIHRPETERSIDRTTPTRDLSGFNIEPNNISSRPANPATQSSVPAGQNENNLLRMARPRDQEKISNIVEYKIASKDVQLDRSARTISTEPETVLQETALRETGLQGHGGISANTISAGTISANTNLEREKKLLVSPRLEVETEGDPRAIVGQEALYRIKIVNRGGSSAEQIILTVEIPNWLEIAQPEISAGTTSLIPREDNKEFRDFVWKISRIETQAEELLVLHLIPQQRKSVDLRIKYDFFKPATVAKIVVQEPILEMELQGPDEVLWGTNVGYKLLVRNTGNGDAENVKLELLQTGSDMKSCELAVLKAGEEQAIDVEVWTGKQEHIDINIQATGQYDITARVNKRVNVLRPNIVMAVDSPTVQFVGSPAEFQIKVQNIGNAAARDIVLSAAIPLGAKFISSTSGGELTPENQIVWKIDSILVGDVFSASVVCEPKREGTCKLETSIGDKSGELASCVGSFEAEAIVELKLEVENPQGPVEIGQEAVYTFNLFNRGTKAAENVEIKTAFGGGLEPYGVEGGINASMVDGQVFFDKIPTVASGQNVVLKVKAKAEKPGNHRMRTEVICAVANVHLVNENTTYFYQKQKGKSTTVVSSDSAISVPVSGLPTQADDPFLK